MTLTESTVATALLIPFVMWFAEALAAIFVGVATVRDYWLPVAHVFPVHIGVIIGVVLFAVAGIISVTKRYSSAKTRKKR
jgi:uncharacterized membrane protein YedE/YeeE